MCVVPLISLKLSLLVAWWRCGNNFWFAGDRLYLSSFLAMLSERQSPWSDDNTRTCARGKGVRVFLRDPLARSPNLLTAAVARRVLLLMSLMNV